MTPSLPPWHLRWTNFRGYRQTTRLDLPGLTLLIGRNNVGKTSAYAPLLLLRQTLHAQNRATGLLFRGELVDFGSYRDAVSDHDVNRDIKFYLDFGSRQTRRRNALEPGSPIPRALEVTFRYSPGHPADVQKSVVYDEQDEPLVTRTRRPDGTFLVRSGILPNGDSLGRPLKEVTELRRALREESPNGFFFTGFGGLLVPSSWRTNKERWSKVQQWYSAASRLLDVYYETNRAVENALLGISYIGPLRSSPQRSYLLSAEPPDNVGRDGEFAAEVLYQSRLTSESQVLASTNEWLAKLGYGRLTFEAQGDYFQVRVSKPASDVTVNLADCGAGLSQLLPLLVQGNSMRAGQTLIAQQPEIHLNPAQQDVMTDFLISLVASGKRVIVETHSEHVLGRLRRRVAEGESVLGDDVALYYCDSGVQGSSLTRIPMGDVGEIDANNWPRGFFNEQLNNSVELALAQSRRRQSDA